MTAILGSHKKKNDSPADEPHIYKNITIDDEAKTGDLE